VLVAATCVLAGCAMPPATEGAPIRARQRARACGRCPPGWRFRQGLSARSNVPSVRYDLAVSGTGELTPDDGVPGDSGPREIFERGGASWYGIQFHQRKTASGERFDMSAP
jgi:rare lipoprotein A